MASYVSDVCPISNTVYGLEHATGHAIGTDPDMLHARMRKLEALGRPKYNPSATYVEIRRLLVDFICEVGESAQLHPSTMHVAVGYLDRVLQGMDVHRSRYQLVAMACFLIAAKYEEAEERVPNAEALNKLAGNPYPDHRLVHQMEILVLTRLNWSLTVVTSAHFLGFFHSRGILFETDSLAYKPLVKKVPAYLKKYTTFFADLTLQEYEFEQYSPSLLAAGIVMAARKALVIRPLWNPVLEQVLHFDETTVAPVMMHIWQSYTKSFATEAGNQDRGACTADRQAVDSGVFGLVIPPAYYSSYVAALHEESAARSASTSPTAGGSADSSIPFRAATLQPLPVGTPSFSGRSAASITPATPLYSTPTALSDEMTPEQPLSTVQLSARERTSDSEGSETFTGDSIDRCTTSSVLSFQSTACMSAVKPSFVEPAEAQPFYASAHKAPAYSPLDVGTSNQPVKPLQAIRDVLSSHPLVHLTNHT